MMQIIVLTGSPNRKGSTNLLADCFRQGAQEAGHTVELIDTAHANIHPCTGCIRCGYQGPCVQKDDVEDIRRKILQADMLVFATPLYYYGMSAQLKTMIDRFCAFNGSIQHKHMKSALLAVAWNSDDWTFTALEAHYTNQGIKETRKLSINIVDEDMLAKADRAGCVSGNKVDKSTLFDYTLDDAGVPVITQSPVTMVCSVEDIYRTKGFESFICTIDATYAQENVVDEAGKLDYHSLKPVLFEMPTYAYLKTGDVIGKCMSFGKESQD